MYNRQTMADEIVFNQDHLNEWTRACKHEGDLLRSGASEKELKAAKMDCILKMIPLLSPHMTYADLGRSILAASLCSPNPETSEPLTDPTD
jgi:hypothetical protein